MVNGMNQFASTTGRFARQARKAMAGLPGLSAPADLIAARYCVDLLATRFKEDPADPLRNVWLAEALLQTQRDLRTLVRLRCVVNPSSIIVRTAVTQVARLGDEADGEDAAVKLLRRAFALAAARRDAAALHVLSRVYLARGMPHEALRFAALAASSDAAPPDTSAAPPDASHRADALVTAARALHKAGRRDDATRAAERAVEQGNTLGYEVLARLLATQREDVTRDVSGRVARVRELRRKVRPEDRARYSGAARSHVEAARAAKSTQWRKAGSTVTDAACLAGRARVAIEKGLTT
jgi:hypothetical protein